MTAARGGAPEPLRAGFAARAIRGRIALAVLVAISISIAPARARAAAPAPAPPDEEHGHGVWRSFRPGAKLRAGIPTAAILGGSWLLSLQIGTSLLSRAWGAERPWGIVGHYSTRLLYGMSWTGLLALETIGVIVASRGDLDWLGDAVYRSDWIFPVDLPACREPGERGGCGVGLGDFGFLQIRPRRSRYWYEAGGGWLQQRVLNDALRTVQESSWVLTPISVVREARTDLDAPVALRVFAGPGVYFGMHAAHVHPTERGARIYEDQPLTQLYPLDAGLGPGARFEARLIFEQRFSLEGELVVAPLVLGGPTRRVSPDVAPLDYPRDGLPVWRRAGVGLAFQDPTLLPFKMTVAFYASELSSRSVDRIGYRGGMLRFEIPFLVPRDDGR